jgi:uncharacterized membrane protein
MSGGPFVVTLIAALACGLGTGALFAFSAFVMAALRRLPDREGITAMQSINLLAVTPAFMTALFGGGALAIVAAIWAATADGGDPAVLAATGAAVYAVGVLGVTMAANVPRNNRLATLNPELAGAAAAWHGYLGEWTAFNHVRVGAGVVAVALLTLSLTA